MTAVPGIEIRIAANHWQLAVDVHNANHPDADHAASDLHEEDPRFFPRTDILWASPECTTWSQAGGAKYANVPVEADLLTLLDEEGLAEDPLTADAAQRSRLLMFDVLRFAEHHRYRAMVIENVVDIAMRPKYRLAWTAWKKALRNLGYEFRVVSLNSMHAQALGAPAPQSRDRLYIVCWRAGDRAPDIDRFIRPIAWCPRCELLVESQQAWKPGKSVGKYRAQYVYVHGGCGTVVEPGWLPAAAAIDWSIVGKRIGDRAKPLAEKTRRRIAAGIARYWGPFHLESGGNQYDAADPKHPQHGDPNAYYRTWSTEDYLRVLHTQETKALAVPAGGTWNDDARPVDQPHRAITTRETTALVLNNQHNNRSQPVDAPMPTLTTATTKGLVEAPFIAELRGGGSDARPVEEPAATFCASGNHHALVTRHYGIEGGDPARHTKPADEALRTMTANGGNMSLLTPYYGTAETAKPASDPVGTLTTRDRYALVHRHNGSKGDGAEMSTPTGEYLRTLTTRGHQSLLTPGDLDAAAAQVDDCLFRMLEPHEVAAGMAFPADYLWQGTRRERVKLAGNAVTPPAARDLIGAVVEALGGAA